jgi:hypothetical protein
MTPDLLHHQLSPAVFNELNQLDFVADPAFFTNQGDDNAAARSWAFGPKPTSFDLLPDTLVHDVGNPNLGASLGMGPNLGVRTETEEEKLSRLSVLFLKSLPPSLTQSSEKPNSFSTKGPTARIQPVTEETQCYRKG